MTVEGKRALEFPIPPPSGNRLHILLIGRTEAECVELQAAFAPLQDILVDTVMTNARFATTMLKTSSPPDIVLVDIDPDSSDDLTRLRDLRKVPTIEQTPIVAVLNRANNDAPLRVIRAGADDVLLKPIDTKEAQEVFARVMEQAKLSRPSSAALGKCVVFLHLSGGVGATTLAVNAACALARVPDAKQVALLDLDIQFGNAASLLDLSGASPMQDFIDDPVRLDDQMLESMMLPHATGLHVLTAPRTLLPFTAYGADGIRSMLDLARRRYGFVVIDLPIALAPWTDTVLRSASVIYLVVGLSVPSAHRVMKFLELLREENIVDLPLKVIANRHQRGNRKGNDITVSQFERATGKKIDYLIPNDYSLISMSHGQGKPAVRLEPNSLFTSALREMLAADLGRDMFAKPRRGFFSFRRA